MKNMRITVLKGDLNLTPDIVFDISKTEPKLDGMGNVLGTTPIYPKQMIFVNTTEQAFEINTFSSDDEYNAYVADPTDFDFIYIPPGMGFSSDGFTLQTAIKFVIRGLGTGATGDLIVDFVNYRIR